MWKCGSYWPVSYNQLPQEWQKTSYFNQHSVTAGYHQKDGSTLTFSSHKQQQISSPSLTQDLDTMQSAYDSVQLPCITENSAFCLILRRTAFHQTSLLNQSFSFLLPLEFGYAKGRARQTRKSDSRNNQCSPFHQEPAVTPKRCKSLLKIPACNARICTTSHC